MKKAETSSWYGRTILMCL